jgi:putative solute:sodium symporter small subunit
MPRTVDLTDAQRGQLRAARKAHWARARRLSALLFGSWLLATFCAIFFARELSRVTLFGWPLSFYLAAQGVALVYLAILGAYAWRMHVLDRAFHAALAAQFQAEPEAP